MRLYRSMLPSLRAAFFTLPLLAASISPAQEADWGDDDWGDDGWGTEPEGWAWYGFIEGATAVRTRSEPLLDEDFTLAETRMQLEGNRAIGRGELSFKGDLWLDGVSDNVESDLREANFFTPIGDSVDLQIGRQILTWGTGDLVFLNDLFPKDFVSFFSGRDDEYLKAPADAAKLSWYGPIAVDLVWMPMAAPDRFLTGERLSYFSPMGGERVAAPPRLDPIDRDDFADDSEFSIRLSKTINGVELAGYGFTGFNKQPTGFDQQAQRATFPRLNVIGASARGSAFGGIVNVETAMHETEPEDQFRFLTGYEHSPIGDLTLGWQYYLESEDDDDRHLLTNRITWQLLQQDLTASFFTFYSASDEGWYLRPGLEYRFSDQLTGSVGGNLFGGDEISGFYSQLENNSNVFLRVRYQF